MPDLTIAKVARIPFCDITGCQRDAHVDTKTNTGPWAYLCTDHWEEYGAEYPRLGLGIGQRLVLA